MKRRDFLGQSAALASSLLLPGDALANEHRKPGWQQPFGLNNKGTPKGRILLGYGKTGLATVIAREGAKALASIYRDIEFEAVNMPGDNTIKATVDAKNAPADGTTILEIQSPQFNSLPVLYRSLPYSPRSDFKPLAIIAEYTMFLTVGPVVDASVQTIQDLVNWLRYNPEYASMGFTQYGSPGHFAQLIFAREMGVAVDAQPYRGTSMMIEDLADGTLATGMVISGNRLDLYESGVLRVIATTGEDSYPGWDHILTCREQGLEAMNIGGWYGWFVHQDVPDEIYNPLKSAVQSIVASQTFYQLMQKYALNPVYADDFELYLRMVQEANLYRSLAESFRLGKV